MGRPRIPKEHHKYGYLWSQVKVDLCDRWLLDRYAWYINRGRHTFYIFRMSSRTESVQRAHLFHRDLLQASKSVYVDHINGDGLDNRRCNLRLCSSRGNLCGQRSQFGTSCYKGVGWNKNAKKWHSHIMSHRQSFHLGYFDDEEGAAFAYDVAARQLFGEFARLNFQEE